MKLSYLSVFVVAIALWGCNPTITKQDFAPKMYEQHPVSILVLPPQNKSTAADAKEYYTTTIAEPLTNSGYYVYPVEVVNDVLKQEGLYDTETMLNVPPQKFKEFFGADAVMYVTILEWDTHYMVIAGSVSVRIACVLKSTTSGDILWFYDDVINLDTSGDSGGAGGLAGLLAKAVTTAIKTAATQYVPIARNVNKQILVAIPYGKYHPDYNKDAKVKIVKKKEIEEKKEAGEKK
jgi:hypothetical protein